MGFMDSLTGLMDPGGFVTGGGDPTFNALTGKSAASAATQASELAAQGQANELEYLKEINKLPQQYREQALAKLSGMSSEQGPAEQQRKISMAESSPIYSAIMGGREAGEESIMRGAAATGGLRSGNVQANMYDYNTQLQNKALATSYAQLQEDENRRLDITKGLAGLDTGTSQIGGVMSDIGKTRAQGLTGAAQATQSGAQNVANIGMGVASLFI